VKKILNTATSDSPGLVQVSTKASDFETLIEERLPPLKAQLTEGEDGDLEKILETLGSKQREIE
jgi:hypothetical protein